MMIKYRVHEVAKDLGLPNKEVIDTLQKYTGETKKTYDRSDGERAGCRV